MGKDQICITRAIILIAIGLLLWLNLDAQKRKKYNDGPYITQVDNALRLQWIENGKKKDSTVLISEATTFNKTNFPLVNLHDLQIVEAPKVHYDSISKFLAISDIHGQHDLFIKLMKAQGVIDANESWSYGAGHLVIVGDVFDRGDKVVETLWTLFRLEKEAIAAGGRVHFLLGNHELMVLHNNLTYLHPKYIYTAGILDQNYADFFNENTTLGRWLRSKCISISINKVAFVHGGFSKQVLEKENSLTQLNRIFKEKVIPDVSIKEKSKDLLSLLYFENGPLWYRDYANPEGFDMKQADYILEALKMKTLVVGHTTMPKIVSIHDNKIFLIDSSIKFGNSGEVLIYEDGDFYRGKMNREKEIIKSSAANMDGPSPFQYVYNLGDGDLTIVLDTDIKKLLKSKMEEKYQKSKLTAIHNEEYNRVWNVRLKTRGNMRKELCHFPPLKIDFSKSTLEYLGFSRHDKLKMVLPCDDTEEYQQKLYREYLIYKMYQIVDQEYALRARLVNTTLKHKGKIKHEVVGFFIEDEENYAFRTKVEFSKEEKVSITELNRKQYLKMLFFQYMIRNIDWTVYSKHNIEVVSPMDSEQVLVIPYDFDFAGIVDHDYAKPKNSTKNDLARKTYFRGFDVTKDEVNEMKNYFAPLQKEFLKIIANSEFLDQRSKKFMTDYVNNFYQKFNDEAQWETYFRLQIE